MPLRSNSQTPSSLACIPCRQRHLKCDALMPLCSRCEQSNVKCHYVASKRGLRQKPTTTTTTTANPRTSPPTTESLDVDISGTSPFYTQTLSPAFSSDMSVNFNTMFQNGDKLPLNWLIPTEFLPSLDDASQHLPGLSNTADETGAMVTAQSGSIPAYHRIAFDPMIKLYYENFHPSHPFLIPPKALGNYDIAQFLPPYLLLMMQFVGSHFHPDPSARDQYQKQAYASLNESSEPTGFKVQAMLLSAIVDHAHGNEGQAAYFLKSAVIMASQLGMQSGSFAGHSSHGDAIFEESWRRTFWELFIVVHLFKTFSGQQNCDIQLSAYQDEDLRKMVELPCDEAIYGAAGPIPPSKTLRQFQNSWRSLDNETEEKFSSFSYRIEAARLWELVQLVNSKNNNALCHVDEIELETLDIRLTTLMIRLMKINQYSFGSFNDFDDPMRSQAQMIALLAIIYLHHPRSKIGLGPWKSACAPACIANGSPSLSEGGTTTDGMEHKDFDPHALKALRASTSLLNMITTSVLTSSSIIAIKRNTPFMICALTMSLMVHMVDAHHYHYKRHCKGESPSISRIELGMRTLDILGEVWPLAQSVRKQLLEILLKG